ncbi:RagB/SusD family nutrient uptake outer membrane protein [Leeuwenhoekiella sp. H156]|uniref:RagB/SusD family nutrient uptake outer membrane protein n=1 Tax=Leeuwenhoekiella sp. H156 TaxID=3450128 RepID=UPI003FA4A128
MNSIKRKFKSLKTGLVLSFLGIATFGLQSCEDTFLDVVPDNVATIEQAFKLRNEAEKYLFTCYSYIPKNGDAVYNIAFLAGDETWIPPQDASFNSFAFDIARNLQRSTDPYMDAWEGRYQGGGPGDRYQLWDGIRHCNIFISNLEDTSKVPDIGEAERLRWISEAKFLKAYYHYYLMRMYGPIPIMKTAIPIDAPEDQIQVPREAIDPSIDYLAELFDEAAVGLPPMITDTQEDLGRITRPIALAVKAEMLTMAASPLFNGNQDMSGFVGNDGTQYFNLNYEPAKWERALTAIKEAIDVAEANGAELFYKEDVSFDIEPITQTKLDIRQAVTERWNREIIWANPNSRTYQLQSLAMNAVDDKTNAQTARRALSPTLETAQMFYTKNGVPIEEDKTLSFGDITTLREAGEEDQYNISLGYRTSILNFDREPRFYADLGFDGSIFYKFDSGSNDTRWHYETKYKDYGGSSDAFNYNVTGYYIKKLINWEQTFTGGTPYKDYAWPEIRLADLYLLYAEVLNEVNGPTPEVFEYLDAVRKRAGLAGVEESWTNFSNNPNKFATKDGLREIIHRERNIEMVFEGKNYWDVRRWKKAASEYNEPIRGWSVFESTEQAYYQVRTLYQQRFIAPRDYFWPLNINTLIQNPSLVQAPGW